MNRLIYALLVLIASVGLGIGSGHVVEAAALPCSVSPGHVTVVVEHQDGSGFQRCVGINGSSAVAEAVLADSGIEYADASTASGFGDELCQVDNEPTTFPSPCLLPGQPYWAMYVSQNGSPWRSSNGVSTQQLNSGDALGLRFVGPADSGQPPMPNIRCPQPASPTQAVSSAHLSTGNASSSSSNSIHILAGGTPLSGSGATEQPRPSATGAALALHITASARAPSDTSAVSWVLLFACAAGGSLLGLMTVRVVRR